MIFSFQPTRKGFSVARAPLARVIAVLRFPLVSAFGEVGGVKVVQERLRGSFPELAESQATQIEVTFGPNVLHQQQRAETQWLSRGHTEKYELTIAPGWLQLAVPGPSYRNREQFSEVLQSALEALAETGQISHIDAFAARYINASTTEPGWSVRWNPAIVGWIENQSVNAAWESSLTQTALKNGDVKLEDGQHVSSNVIIRHGLVSGVGSQLLPAATTTPAFVVDCELQTLQRTTFDIPTILSMFREYNHEMARFFDFALSDQGRVHFGMEDA